MKTSKNTPKVKSASSLTLRDKLSRLTYQQAVKRLGSNGAELLRSGGGYEIDIDNQVKLDNHQLSLWLDPKVSIRLFLNDSAKRGIDWQCSCPETHCEHVGAAFSLVLEEKTALGLALAPEENQLNTTLSEEALIDQALQQRRERAATEKMRIKSQNPKQLWTDYQVTNALSGKSYRVALRGWQRGDSYCSCPDYRKNSLGTCKHILHVEAKVQKKFSKASQTRPYQREHLALHLAYGEAIELRLLLPQKQDKALQKIISPISNKAIGNMHDLLNRLQRIERMGHSIHIYPDAEEYIQQRLFQERIKASVDDVRDNPAEHPLRENLLKVPLLPYQLDGIAFVVGAGRAILADDMGLGKTIQGIGVAEWLAREAGIQRVLVISPTSLKSQWREEIHKFCERDAQIVIGSAQERVSQYRSGAFFTLCNYEQILRDIVTVSAQQWDLIILDEGQRIKNWEAKTSQAIKTLRSRFALILSGTPLENRLDDLFSVVEFVDDRRLGPAYRFFNSHRVLDEKGKVVGYKNLSAIRKRLEPILLRRTRASVMQQLPPRHNEVIRITPTEEQLQLHDGHRRIVSAILQKKYISEMDLLRLQKALLMCRMVANSSYLVDKQAPGYSSKLEELNNLLTTLAAEEDRKIVLFSEWTTMLDLIEPLLKTAGLDFVRLDGSVPQKKRQQLVHRFQTDPKCQVFMTSNAGSTGLNLQAANTIINVDLPWNPAVLEQRIARAHRMGQKRPVQVFLLVTEQTIEESMLATLSAKHQLALAALDPDTDIDQVDLSSGLDELKQRLEVLLGAVPEAPVDESARQLAEQQVERQQRVAEAGGQMLSAAFEFLNELLPEEKSGQSEIASKLKDSLSDCIKPDDQGGFQLTVKFRDKDAIDKLAQSMAGLLALSQT